MELENSMERLVCAFKSLPGVGYKTAQRYAYYIISQDKQNAIEFANAILNAKEKFLIVKNVETLPMMKFVLFVKKEIKKLFVS